MSLNKFYDLIVQAHTESKRNEDHIKITLASCEALLLRLYNEKHIDSKVVKTYLNLIQKNLTKS